MAGIFTVSPRITEYGSDKEIKNGWNAFTPAGAATPMPTDGDNANHLRTTLWLCQELLLP